LLCRNHVVSCYFVDVTVTNSFLILSGVRCDRYFVVVAHLSDCWVLFASSLCVYVCVCLFYNLLSSSLCHVTLPCHVAYTAADCSPLRMQLSPGETLPFAAAQIAVKQQSVLHNTTTAGESTWHVVADARSTINTTALQQTQSLITVAFNIVQRYSRRDVGCSW